ncbi:uncharacterized protein VTP21DRAFT_51 [Calcarisporiella thermophila]|uniref:uncharacterized protein n=1 Tax=Calcarisporiella thermophila TaxID=911321 RepID=UPI0037420921
MAVFLRYITLSAIVALFLANAANATFYTTFPYGESVVKGDDTMEITWKEDNNTPPIKQFGDFKLELMTGTDLVQSSLAVIAPKLSGAETKIKFKVPKNVGPAGKIYFLRYTSLKNPELVAFSTRFTILDVNGPVPDVVKQNQAFFAPLLQAGASSGAALPSASASATVPASSGVSGVSSAATSLPASGISSTVSSVAISSASISASSSALSSAVVSVKSSSSAPASSSVKSSSPSQSASAPSKSAATTTTASLAAALLALLGTVMVV